MTKTKTSLDHLTQPIKRRLNTLVAITVVLIVLMGGVTAYTTISVSQNHHALCTLRSDLVHRVQSSKKFLHTHPHGVAGISAQTIQQSLNGQLRTISALSDLSC